MWTGPGSMPPHVARPGYVMGVVCDVFEIGQWPDDVDENANQNQVYACTRRGSIHQSRYSATALTARGQDRLVTTGRIRQENVAVLQLGFSLRIQKEQADTSQRKG